MPVTNEDEVEWTEVDHGRTHFRRKSLSEAASGEGDPGIGCSLYQLPPGGASWPYHYHEANAEAILCRSGTGTLRLADGERPLGPGDYVPLPVGEAGAHRVVNEGDDPVEYYVISTMVEPEITVYPDSAKLGVYAGSPPGGRDERSVDGYYRRGDTVSYWDGE